mgnify:CR=1 FL=1
MIPFYQDWKFWLFIVALFNTLVSIFSYLVNEKSFSQVMNNELKHLTEDVKEIRKDLKKVIKKVIQIETRCEERHGKVK